LFTPFIGLGGILYSHFIGHISPETWNPDLSLLIIFATLIGGASNILGPIVGSIIATGIPISFDITMEFRFGIVGIVAILIFLFKPQGIVGWIKDIIHQNRKNGVIAS
jgi:branched-chain amino acid transport system permease protein